MKLLMVEDNLTLAELTAGLLHALDEDMQLLEAITLASHFQSAILCLSEHDAVLCADIFPLSPHSRFRVEDWDVVRQEAQRRGIHFVLYSGSLWALNSARETHTLTIAKPSAIEENYAALTNFPLSVTNRGYRKSA
jgi:hypothetical protein